MSSCPGDTLELFLMWSFDLIVDGDVSANPSLQIAEAIGTATEKRREMTAEDFKPIVDLFEPFRQRVESKLKNYSEERYGSWRDYAGWAFDFLSESLYEQAQEFI